MGKLLMFHILSLTIRKPLQTDESFSCFLIILIVICINFPDFIIAFTMLKITRYSGSF